MSQKSTFLAITTIKITAMKTSSKLIVPAILAISFGALHAATTVYTIKSDFLAAIASPYMESFNSLPSQPPSPILFSSGGYDYSASSAGFYNVGAPSPGDVWLSLNYATDLITFSFTSGNVFGVGGYFFTSDVSGAAAVGNVGLATNDGTSRTITSSTPGSFIGFVSDVPITGLTVSAIQPGVGALWPTVNDLTVGSTSISSVPEPTNLIASAIFIGSGLMIRIRRLRVCVPNKDR